MEVIQLKIHTLNFQPVIPKLEKKKEITSAEAKSELTPVQQFEQSRNELKAMGQRFIAELEEARTDMGEDDPKAQRLIEKFKSGKKLTPEELAYVRKNAPGMRDFIDRIMREREMIEMSMRQAPSKTDVQMVVYRASKQIEREPNADLKELRAKHLADAKQEYEQTNDYKEKPNSPLDREQRAVRLAKEKKPKPYNPVAIASYEKVSKFEGKQPIDHKV